MKIMIFRTFAHTRIWEGIETHCYYNSTSLNIIKNWEKYKVFMQDSDGNIQKVFKKKFTQLGIRTDEKFMNWLYSIQQELGGLADIVRRERDTEKTYASGVAGEVERAKDAQRQFSGQGGAVQGYWKGLQDIFEGAQVAATDVAIAGDDLLNAWADFGGTRNLGGTPLTGMGVTGYGAFQESDTGGWAPYQQFEGTEGAPQRAERFAQDLIDQASAKISGLEINPDVDLSLIGQ